MAVMTRSPRPSAGPRLTKSTWSSSWWMMAETKARQRARSEGVNWHFKDRVLEVVAEPPHKLKDFAKALVVADVVTDEIRSAHLLSGGAENRYSPSVGRHERS